MCDVFRMVNEEGNSSSRPDDVVHARTEASQQTSQTRGEILTASIRLMNAAKAFAKLASNFSTPRPELYEFWTYNVEPLGEEIAYLLDEPREQRREAMAVSVPIPEISYEQREQQARTLELDNEGWAVQVDYQSEYFLILERNQPARYLTFQLFDLDRRATVIKAMLADGESIDVPLAAQEAADAAEQGQAGA